MDRQDIYAIETVEELQRWASRHGLSFETDSELNLRRIQLMADSITNVPKCQCDTCGKTFKQRSHLLRHVRTLHGNPSTLSCDVCQQTFKRSDNLKRHMDIHKENIEPSSQGNSNQVPGSKKRRIDVQTAQAPCNWCTKVKPLVSGKKFCAECGQQGRECKWCHRPLPERFYGQRTDVCTSCIGRRENYEKRRNQVGGAKSALDDTAQIASLDPSSSNVYDVLQFFKDNQNDIESTLTERLKFVKGLKWFITLYVKFIKYNQNNEAVYDEPTFRSVTMTVTNSSQIEDQIAEVFQNLHTSYQNFERDGSGWSIDKIIRLEISTVEYKPIDGSSFIPLPPRIQSKKAVLNIKNNDQKCFLWSVLAALYPVSWGNNPNRVSHYVSYEKELKLHNIYFPTPLSQVSQFERINGISVNVFGLEGHEVYPLQITEQRSMSKHVNLLLFSKGEQRHYCLIKNLSRLLGDRTLHDGETFYCNYCLHGFTTRDILEEHVPYCSPHGPQKISFPKDEEQQWVYFNRVQNQLKVPFVIYADFESFIKPISSCSPDPSTSFTTKFQKHEPCGFSYFVKCASDDLSGSTQVYRGENVIDTFFDRLIEEENKICKILSEVKPMNLTREEERLFSNASICHICQKDLGADKVRDHDHLNGRYRGAAHSECNLHYQFKQSKRSRNSKFHIPVIFHNLRGYDMHLLMESAGKYKDRPISCIPNNMEKYLSFSLGNLKFIDSLQFLNASLDTLVSNLANGGVCKFPNLARHFPETKNQKLLLRKGVYCYSYITSSDKFEETSLPSKEYFYNDLNEIDLSEADYEYAKLVWDRFGCETLGDFHDFYLVTDVLLLSDVFENFRDVCLQYYQLDPCHYYSAPGFSWDAMLKMSGVQLQLLNDISMVNMLEHGVRGGLSMISKKFARSNNPKVKEYDQAKPLTWLTYLDMNNLYGTAMCEPLPEKDFDWLTEQEIQQLDICSVPDDAQTGYVLEVDLHYPQHLHDTHNDYPLAPDSLNITESMLSEHCTAQKEIMGIKAKTSTKLVPTLQDKCNYVIHYRNLKYYLSKGLELVKIHRVLSFSQSKWLMTYIQFNTEKRKQAKSTFEKDLFKLFNNSVFGKIIENMRKRVHVELVNTPKRLRKVCAKPNFQSFKIFNPDLVAVHMKKQNIVLNRPMYAGFCILDISKIFMYQFHYDFIKHKYGEKAQLLFTDTDSLCYEIETDDWYQDMFENNELFDTSNFDKDHYLFSIENSKVLGKMKDECGGNVVEEFVGLRPKMYSLKYGNVESKKAKGIKKSVVEKDVKHEMYRDCLERQTFFRHSMNLIRSYEHQLYSISINKISLSPYDDKRYFTGIESYSYGHYKINKK